MRLARASFAVGSITILGLLTGCATEATPDENSGDPGAGGGTGQGGGGPGQGGAGGQECVPGDEICNGADDDCDGETDEGCDCVEGDEQDCYSGPDGTADVGECKTGTQTCAENGMFGRCTGEVLPGTEVCNGLDDDCNGETDELPDLSCGIGACAVTAPACVNGRDGTCTPLQPSIEICDGLDNDCDQQVDDSFPNQGMACDSGVPGICSAGKLECINGAETCTPDLMPVPETCNTLDDDCNGTVDDNVPGTGGSCTTGAPGVCDAGIISCQNGVTDCFPITPPSPEVCDGLDNDCDGQVDQGDPEGGTACMTGQQGACAVGTEHCLNGAIACVPDAMSQPEACNGEDDDCDGSTDEGNPNGGGPCSCGGNLNCVGGALVCQNCTKEFVCNDNIDDDNDGLTDCSDPECAFACSIAPCAQGQDLVTEAASDVPKPIPDVQTTTSNIGINYAGTVARAVVRIGNLTHTFDADLDISFKGANTASVDLSSDNGSSGDNFINTTFDNLCATPITLGAPPFTGCFSPETPLSALAGAPVSQVWTLTIVDDLGGDTGTLTSWAVAFCVDLP